MFLKFFISLRPSRTSTTAWQAQAYSKTRSQDFLEEFASTYFRASKFPFRRSVYDVILDLVVCTYAHTHVARAQQASRQTAEQASVNVRQVF